MNNLVKRLRDEETVVTAELIKEAADRIEKLEAALRLIAQNNYGLQGMMEDGTDTPESRAEYYAGQVSRRQNIARTALEGKDD
jgi:hypothetical protein